MRRRSFSALILAVLSVVLIGSPPGAAQPPTGRGVSLALKPQRPGTVDVYVLSFGLWGPQSVFASEAKGAARILESRFDARGRSIVRFNSKTGAGATPPALYAAAHAVASAVDPAEDVVVLVLTSHGGPEGIGLVAGRSQILLRPRDVGRLLDATGARYRVLIVSACYSGIFAHALADSRTLVITAAAPDKPSFGCRDGAAWTYFGDAFFNRALRGDGQLDRAFTTARELVTARERQERFDPSNPQIAGGEEVLAKLRTR